MKRSLLALAVALTPLLSCAQKKEVHRLPVNKTQTAVLYNDGTWKYINGTAAAKTSSTASGALPLTTAAPAPAYRPSAASYSGSSSTCGAPTKKGGPCRRKVRGGGYCWQHS